MKNIVKTLLLSVCTATLLWSCTKDENKNYFEGGTAPVLSASSADTMKLLKDNKDNAAITFSWTNPNYSFTTGPSSQDVNYLLQVDTTGVNFSSGNIQQVSIARNLGVTLTTKQLNDFLVKMELTAGKTYNMEIRIKASLTNGSVPQYSNVLKIPVVPYLDFVVEPPGTLAANYDDGNLWLTGNAVASNYSNPLPSPYDVTQKFTKSDVLHYTGTFTFNATGGYKLIQKQGDWDTQYHAVDGTAALEGVLEKKNSDPAFPSPGAGNYKVEINFQTGKYKLTKL